jgi:hypothetical protein
MLTPAQTGGLSMRSIVRVCMLVALMASTSCGRGEAGGSADEMSVEAYASETNGAVQVTSADPTTGDWFEVLENGEQVVPGNPPLLGSTLEVPPGTYQVVVNRTERTVTVGAGRLTILRTGDLLVEGEPDGAMWYPEQGGDRKVVSNPPTLNAGIALFSGDYEVIVYEGVGVPPDTVGVARVVPGRVTTMRR